MKPADVRLELTDGIVRARLLGEIDLSNVRELRQALMDATPNDALGMVLDLSEVDYLDSAGIHLLYRVRESLRMRGQALAIVIPLDSIVSEALRLAAIARGADIFETLEDAVSVLLPEQTGPCRGASG